MKLREKDGEEGSYEGSNSTAPHVRRERREASAKGAQLCKEGKGLKRAKDAFPCLANEHTGAALTNYRGDCGTGAIEEEASSSSLSLSASLSLVLWP